jgi:nucleotide-binding universal stress UspA family protein
MSRIVVGIDGSEPSQRALRWAVEEARLRRVTLEIVHAWHLPSAGGYPYLTGYMDIELFEKDAQQVVDQALAEVGVAGVPEVQRLVVEDTAGRALLDAAKGAEMVVLGSRGRGGFAGLLLGSVGLQVATHATCPVVVIS